MRIATVKSQMEMFEQCYARFLQHPTIQFPIVLTSDTQLDMNAVILCCIQCYLRLADCNINVLGSVNKSFPYSAFIDTQIPKKSSYDQNSLIKNAFVLAAVGAFDDVSVFYMFDNASLFKLKISIVEIILMVHSLK